MSADTVHFWKKAPFTRLLFPLAAGILLQWYHPIDIRYAWFILFTCIGIITCFFFIPFFSRYKLGPINGIASCFLFICFGVLLVWYQDIRNNNNWLGNFYRQKDALIVTLDEPLIEKPKSFKANGIVSYLQHGDTCRSVCGRIILYFKKDSLAHLLSYGSMIIFHKPLQEISNAGNPGGFDYKRYSVFQGITHQVYLQPGEFELLPGKKINTIQQFIYNSREWVLQALRNNITGNKETGLAEALLIGYKNDLDKELVQSYSNTGVVHVIAISGLHLGLIYGLLIQLFKPLQHRKKWNWLRPLLIIAGLWLFSWLAGAQPSVLRSALMFSCIVLGEGLSRKTSVFNTLACSAFLLLCINPYWLWDVGFQLSYAAVLSIVIFMKPIYNCFYYKNKLLDLTWKLNAVTLAAQILTLPLSIYHFHQFPNYFLLTNFVAVPLSSLILIIEIIVCAISFIPVMAVIAGKITAFLILLMNAYVERIESLPFSLWQWLQINTAQAVLFFLFISFSGYWLLARSIKGLSWALLSFLVFAALRSFSFIQTGQQQMVIIYNIPRQQAIDLVMGRQYIFAGDSTLSNDDFIRNFYFNPARTLYRVHPAGSIPAVAISNHYISYGSLHILFANGSLSYLPAMDKQTIDILLISKNERHSLDAFNHSFIIRQVVADGSMTDRSLKRWKSDCDAAAIPFHDLAGKGAFEMRLR